MDVQAFDLRREPAASSGETPNFEPTWPVRIDSCVSASIPGVMRTSIRSTPAARARSSSSTESRTTYAACASTAAASSLVRLVVAVDHQPLGRDAGVLREAQLAEGRHVGAEPLVGEQAQDRDVRERLRPVDDECVRRRGPVRPCARPDRLLAVDDERRAELVRERRRAGAADRQLAVDDLRRVGEELEGRVSPPTSSSDRARRRRRGPCSARPRRSTSLRRGRS